MNASVLERVDTAGFAELLRNASRDNKLLTLKNKDLSYIDFGNLSNIHFVNCVFNGCRCAGVNLENVGFYDCHITQSIFTDTSFNNVRINASKFNTCLWKNCHIPPIDTVGKVSKCSNSQFNQSRILDSTLAAIASDNCIFNRCDLHTLNLDTSKLFHCIFHQCSMSDIVMNMAQWDYVSLISIPLYESKLSNAQFSRSKLAHIEVMGYHLLKCSFDNTDLVSSRFTTNIIEDCSFNDSLLCDSTYAFCDNSGFIAFGGSDLQNAHFSWCNLHDLDMCKTNLFGVQLFKSTFDILNDTDFDKKQLEDMSIQNSIIIQNNNSLMPKEYSHSNPSETISQEALEGTASTNILSDALSLPITPNTSNTTNINANEQEIGA